MSERLDAYIATNARHSLPQSRRPTRGGNRLSTLRLGRSTSYDLHEISSSTQDSDLRRTPPANVDAALDAIVAAGRRHPIQNIQGTAQRPRRVSTSNVSDRFDISGGSRRVRGDWHSLNSAQNPGFPVSSSGTDYASERARYNKARVEWKGHDPWQIFDATASEALRSSALRSGPGLHLSSEVADLSSPGPAHPAAHNARRRAKPLHNDTPLRPLTTPQGQDGFHHKMSSTVDAFLGQILHSVSQRDGQRLTSFIILDFDSLPEDRRQPYGDLHNELNQRYPATKDAALSTKVRQALPPDQLLSCHSAFTESIVQYFRYVRDYVNDSALLKARKIEKLTRSV